MPDSPRRHSIRVRSLTAALAAVAVGAALAGCSAIPDPRPLTADEIAQPSEPTTNTGAGPVPKVRKAVPNPHDLPRLPAGIATSGKVMGVGTDGALKIIFAGGVTQRVRLIGLDIPPLDPVRPQGAEAVEYLRRATVDKVVWVVPDSEQRDSRNRLVAYVWLADRVNAGDIARRESMLNARLLIAGLARVVSMPPDTTFDTAFAGYEREARLARKGIWADEGASDEPLPDEQLGSPGGVQ